MENYATTYWLGTAHIALVLTAFAFTARPFVSTYHWLLLLSFIAFGVRPILAASVSGYTNYDSGIAWYAYNLGLLYQLLFMLCLSAIYLLMYSTHRPPARPLERVPTSRAFWVLFAIGALVLCVLQTVSGGAWLPGNRTGTINSVVPGGKYIFPFAVMSFSLLIPFGVIGYMKRVGIRRWVVILASIVSITALSLLYMRGMVITGVFLILWAAEREGKLKPKHLIIGLAAMFLIGQLLRPVGKLVSSAYTASNGVPSSAATKASAQLSLADRLRGLFLFTTNMDVADSWPVVIDCADHEGLLYGRSFLAVPARFASTKFRLDSGLLTGSDRVNEFFYGSNYANTSFGFNVTLANELLLNFSIVGLLLGVLPGFAIWTADKWLFRVRSVNAFGLFVAFVCFRGFTNELATTVQWAVGALILGLIVEALANVRFGKRRRPMRAGRMRDAERIGT